ncbi:uracil phosphoribosyltransferase [Echinicola pacifica]|uniref:Uracil phosphoribosyltransferase n=2 Tax=Echinicola pacifica TaxID=346377 RepID=A0A918PWD3_9BACT|nr:uracil phosphoribosyltransferase [Echinicola pacifica]
MERLGEVMAYELSKSMAYQPLEITTPLAKTVSPRIENSPVIISVMRAAVPFYQGFINYFDEADSGFIGAYRNDNSDGKEVDITFSYLAAPSIEGREVILVDPMLATGKSLVTSVEQLLKNGTPKKVHIAAIIAAPEGVEYIQDSLNLPYEIWLGAMDEKLNDKAYIVPGLGDAGDLAFGPKL